VKTILVTLGGSRAYGIHSNTSDVDLKGVFVGPIDHYLGINNLSKPTIEDKGIGWFADARFYEKRKDLIGIETEGTNYELIKFLRMAMLANPNILDCLFCHPDDILYVTRIGQSLIDNRHKFLSKTCFSAFRGYAHTELEKVRKLLGGAADSSGAMLDGPDQRAPQMRRNILQGHKHAAHSVRILQTFEELIVTGNYVTRRPNPEQLLSIRAGNYTFQWLKEFFESSLERLKELEKTSTLKETPNYEFVNELCQEILFETFDLERKSW